MNKEWTGERLETFVTGETMQEHLHRYAFAAELAKRKRVLDIACGEGYGSALMAREAVHVTAMDIDTGTIRKAAAKYNSPNLSFRVGSALRIDAEKENFDLVTCFETLEHLEEHDQLLSELKRVLKPEGVLLISTPEKATYSDKSGYKNPFHKKELYGPEFKNLLSRFFSYTQFYRQNSISGSLLFNEADTSLKIFYKGNDQGISGEVHPETQYWLAIASDIKISVPGSGMFLSEARADQVREEQTRLIKKTMTYRTGEFILSPFKLIRSLFKK